MNLIAKRVIPAGVVALVTGVAALAVATSPASAATPTASSTSQNWAGYMAANNNFSAVTGSWVEPSASCTSRNGYSAFWVGLGGASGASALEQVGTQSNCTSSGATEYYAWYELVPAAPVKLDLAVKPGDRMGGKVSVNGTNVTLTIWNYTTGQSVSKTVSTSNIDTSSAEWIAEAPSACDSYGNCQPLTLANFGSVKFTGASATAGGHSGSISDPNWQSQSVQLDGSSSGPRFGALGVAYAQSGSGGAQTSTLSGDGGSFSVAYQSASAQATGSSGSSDPSAGGSGSGAGGYGYGPGGYGYGAGGDGGGYGGSVPYGYGGGGPYGYGGYGSYSYGF